MATTIGSLDLNAFSDLYDDSTQYFWFESNATATYGAGAHVTLVPDTSFISNPTGQNILMNTDGFSIRNGLLPMMTLDNNSLDFNVVDTTAGTYVPTATFGSTGATIGQTNGVHIQISSSGLDVNTDSSTKIANFGVNGAQIGQSNKTHVNVYSNSLELTDSAGITFFKARDAVNESGQVTDTFVGDGSTTQFTLSYMASNTNYTVTQNGTTVSPTKTTTQITFSTAPAVGDIIVVVYNVTGNSAKAYDLGMRKTNTISGDYSVVEGYYITASGAYSHAEGRETTASGSYSHAEGYGTIASGISSHAEGYYTTASGSSAHAEGYGTTASGMYSHAEGAGTTASRGYSHAEGYYTTASGMSSHAQNRGTYASKNAQTSLGTYNIKDTSTTTIHPSGIASYGQYAVIVGNGTSDTARSNALTVDWNGNAEAAGDYYSKVNQISLGTYITGGVLTNGSSDIHFSIPTGRVFPNGTTISKLTFNIVVRAGNSNASGMYIVKSASGGTDVKYYDSTASFQFYNGANQSKTLTTAMSTIVLQGGTNIDVHWLGSGNYFFSGSSTYNGYVNNQPIAIMLTGITATLNIPS